MTKIATYNFIISLTAGLLFLNANVSNAAITISKLDDGRVYGDFVVGPGKVDAELSPGESRTFDITVVNRLGKTQTFVLSKEDFRGSSEPDQTVVLLGDDKSPYSLRDHVNIGASKFELAQGMEAHVPVTIYIPSGANPGGLYGSVIVSLSDGRVNAESASSMAENPVVTRIGTLFFVRVKGAADENGHLDKFMISNNRLLFVDSEPVIFHILYKNEGNVHNNPFGKITISNMLGSTVAHINVEPWFAMPESVRFREVSWDPPFLFGRYVAKAEINRGYGDVVDSAEVIFWVIPWKVVLLVLLVVAVVIYVLRKFLDRFVKTSNQ